MLVPLLIIGLLAIYDGYRAARSTADDVSDRVLSGSALAIAERVFVNDENDLEVDIPYVALQMLTSSEDDRVFYRIETDDRSFVTGYRGLQLPETEAGINEVTFADGLFRGTPIRIAVFHGAASSNSQSFGFRVGIAETTNARNAIAHSILVRSMLRQAVLLFAAAVLIWFAVAHALKPLQRLELAVSRRSPDDMRPIEHEVPNEVQGLVRTINGLVERFASSIRALQNFTSNASHQFRTPLSLIKTHLEIASRETDTDKKDQAMRQVSAAVDDAERLMSQMLLLARLDSTSKQHLLDEQCDLTEIAREVCNEFILQLSHHGRDDVDLGFHADQSVIINGERTLLQEVIRNLVDNAIKHSGKAAHVDVYVSIDGSRAQLAVRDHGCGYDLSMTAAVEDQLKSQRLHTGQGAGLGLAIVRDIIELHQGRLSGNRTTDPTGMEVRVTLPLI